MSEIILLFYTGSIQCISALSRVMNANFIFQICYDVLTVDVMDLNSTMTITICVRDMNLPKNKLKWPPAGNFI